MAKLNGVEVYGALLEQSRALGRIEGDQKSFRREVNQRLSAVEEKLERLPGLPPRVPLTKLLPYLYGLTVLAMAVAGRVEWATAASIIKLALKSSH